MNLKNSRRADAVSHRSFWVIELSRDFEMKNTRVEDLAHRNVKNLWHIAANRIPK